jgi:hypothetical protein
MSYAPETTKRLVAFVAGANWNTLHPLDMDRLYQFAVQLWEDHHPPEVASAALHAAALKEAGSNLPGAESQAFGRFTSLVNDLLGFLNAYERGVFRLP